MTKGGPNFKISTSKLQPNSRRDCGNHKGATSLDIVKRADDWAEKDMVLPTIKPKHAKQ